MKRIVTYRPSLGETALAILDGCVTAALGTFFPHPYYHAFCTHTRRKSFYNALKRLERKHLVGFRRRVGREEWYLTAEGERRARRLNTRLSSAKQAQRWDGKWRLVMFDVPERVRSRRNFLRRELSGLGFHQLQKSVWVIPYPPPEDFTQMIAELELGKNFRIAVAETIYDDDDLKALFFPRRP